MPGSNHGEPPPTDTGYCISVGSTYRAPIPGIGGWGAPFPRYWWLACVRRENTETESSEMV